MFSAENRTRTDFGVPWFLYAEEGANPGSSDFGCKLDGQPCWSPAFRRTCLWKFRLKAGLQRPEEPNLREPLDLVYAMKIGGLTISNRLTLAPMEEHTNFPFRLMMKQAGAGLVVTERIDAADVARRDRRALRLLYTQPSESPRAGQISGVDPQVMAAAARVVAELGFNLVDLNFECPIRRLLARGEGGALMASPERIGQIVDAVVRAVAIPVTIKIRSGPDAGQETAVEVAQRAEDAGAAAVSVHARSVQQAYIGGRTGACWPAWQGHLPAGHRRRRHSRG